MTPHPFIRATALGAHRQAMKVLLPFALAFAPSAALADTVTLSPAEIEAAKEAGAERNARDAQLGIEPMRDRKIHGEVGFAVGTGGYAAIFGTAVAPLGDDGVIALSFANEQYGDRRSRRVRRHR